MLTQESIETQSATLNELLGELTDRPTFVRASLKRWSDSSPDGFVRVALLYIARTDDGPHTRHLARMIAVEQRYHERLIDTSFLKDEQAVVVARLLSAADREFFSHLMQAGELNTSVATANRILAIVTALEAVNRVVPWIRRLTQDQNRFIRSKAVKILCQLYANPLLIEKQLESPDPRVRANAIEALWGIDTEVSRRLLDRATQDENHRVAANALLGLHMLGDTEAVDRTVGYADHADPLFRAAMAWVMGQSANGVFRDALKTLVQDPIPGVRSAAQMALKRLPEIAPMPVPMIKSEAESKPLDGARTRSLF